MLYSQIQKEDGGRPDGVIAGANKIAALRWAITVPLVFAA